MGDGNMLIDSAIVMSFHSQVKDNGIVVLGFTTDWSFFVVPNSHRVASGSGPAAFGYHLSVFVHRLILLGCLKQP